MASIEIITSGRIYDLPKFLITIRASVH